MALYTIGDLHLSLACKKPMDIFSGWKDYVERLQTNWNAIVTGDDTVVIAGDISWAMNINQSLEDFRFIENLNGKKIILKGNHDYYWTTLKKMNDFFNDNGLKSLRILHNNSYEVENVNICGTRGWMLENADDFNKKIILREQSRLEASLKAVKNKELETVVFLHYPPIFNQNEIVEFTQVLQNHNIRRCYYGHIHGKAHKFAPQGTINGINYRLISCDYTEFKPIPVG